MMSARFLLSLLSTVSPCGVSSISSTSDVCSGSGWFLVTVLESLVSLVFI